MSAGAGGADACADAAATEATDLLLQELDSFVHVSGGSPFSSSATSSPASWRAGAATATRISPPRQQQQQQQLQRRTEPTRSTSTNGRAAPPHQRPVPSSSSSRLQASPAEKKDTAVMHRTKEDAIRRRTAQTTTAAIATTAPAEDKESPIQTQLQQQHAAPDNLLHHGDNQFSNPRTPALLRGRDSNPINTFAMRQKHADHMGFGHPLDGETWASEPTTTEQRIWMWGDNKSGQLSLTTNPAPTGDTSGSRAAQAELSPDCVAAARGNGPRRSQCQAKSNKTETPSLHKPNPRAMYVTLPARVRLPYQAVRTPATGAAAAQKQEHETTKSGTLRKQQSSLVAKIVLGRAHSVCLTFSNDVYTAGSWLNGRLGPIGRNTTYVTRKKKQSSRKTNASPPLPRVMDARDVRHFRRVHGLSIAPTRHGKKCSSRTRQQRLIKDAHEKNVTVLPLRHGAHGRVGEETTLGSPSSCDSSCGGDRDGSGEEFDYETLSKQREVVSIACGDTHSVALMRNGSLYTWGGSLFGKLGGHPSVGKASDMPSSGGDADQRRKHRQQRPYRVVSAMYGKRITVVDCGHGHTVLCTSAGECYAFGGGGRFFNFGQLGQGDRCDSLVPRLVPSLANVRIVYVACGGYHTLALNDAGHVFSWGRGEYGQLGLGNSANQNEPRLIEALVRRNEGKDNRVTAIACGDHHSLCISGEHLDVLSFGSGQQGQLGHKSSRNECVPCVVEGLRGIPIAQIAAGWRHSLALTAKEGAVYSWGLSDRGQLGHGDTMASRVPKRVVALQHVRVRQIAAGGSHSLASNTYFENAVWMGRLLAERLETARERQLEKEATRLWCTENGSMEKAAYIDTWSPEDDVVKEGDVVVVHKDSIITKEEGYQNGSGGDLAAAAVLEPVVPLWPQEIPQWVSMKFVPSESTGQVHRFATFCTAVPEQEYSAALARYTTLSYRLDPMQIFDNVVVAPAEESDTLTEAKEEDEETDNFSPQVLRVTFLTISKDVRRNPRNVELGEQWPVWARSFYRMMQPIMTRSPCASKTDHVLLQLLEMRPFDSL